MGLRLITVVTLCLLHVPARAAAGFELVPSHAPRGARALIVGSALDAPDVAVLFTTAAGVVAAPVVGRTATTLEIVVPQSAVSGPVTLRGGGATVGAAAIAIAPDPPFIAVQTLVAGDPKSAREPVAVAVRFATGDVYVADRRQHQIRRVAPDGTVSIVAGSGRPGFIDGEGAGAMFHEPGGIAIDESRGVLYVSDSGNHAIRRITFDGVVTTLAGSGRPGSRDGSGAHAELRLPSGIAVAPDRLYVADSGNHQLRAVSHEGVVSTLAGMARPGHTDGSAFSARFHQPRGIAVASDGTIYVADTMNHTIRAVSSGGDVRTLAGTGVSGAFDGPGHLSQFAFPTGIAVDDTGDLFVTERQSHTIRKIDVGDTIEVSTVAGTGRPGLVDGSPLQAAFHGPEGLGVAGAMFVADTMNGALRGIGREMRAVDIYPRRGPAAGGNDVFVFGSGFVPGQTRVRVGGADGVVEFVTSTLLKVRLPAGDGAADVRVETPIGVVTLAGAYAYVPPPTIARVEPAKGSIAGGQQITIGGSGFVAGDTIVRFGPNAANAAVTDAAPVNDTTSVGTTAISVTPTGEHGGVAVTIVTPGGSATLADAYAYFAPPELSGFVPASGRAGTLVTLSGRFFDADPAGNAVSLAGRDAVVLTAGETVLTFVVPEGAISGPITLTTAGGTVVSSASFTVPSYVAIRIEPAAATMEVGGEGQFTAHGVLPDGSTEVITDRATWTSANPDIVTVDSAGIVRAHAAGTATLRAAYLEQSASAEITVASASGLPPDPAAVAPPVDPAVPTSFSSSVEFLYTGSNPIQRDVAAAAIEAHRVAVLRGRVLDREGEPVSAVRISVLGAPNFGYTLTRADGRFDIALNGGGQVTLDYVKAGYLPVQRQLAADWNRFEHLPDVVMMPFDETVTPIAMGSTAMQVARGSVVADEDGERQATLLVPAGTGATMRLADGTEKALETLAFRATEYTVGSTGVAAMPADLPPQSAYTYCVELSADEAVVAGATQVTFSQPVIFYLDNFLGFDAGSPVPAGWYDRAKGQWEAAPNGRVIQITAVDGPLATIDITGDGLAESEAELTAFGITTDERERLRSLYQPGSTLWRVPVAHFTPYDLNWGWTLPPDAVPPTGEAPVSDTRCAESDIRCGSIIDVQNQALGESLRLPGTAMSLEYRSARTRGRTAAYTITIPLSGASVPSSLQRIDAIVELASGPVEMSFQPAPNQKWTVTWDGRDAYGRVVQGEQRARVRIGYAYVGDNSVVVNRLASFGLFGGSSTARVTRRDMMLWSTRDILIGTFTNEGLGLGGWSLSGHHVYDPVSGKLYLGDGAEQRVNARENTISTTIAGWDPEGGFFGGFSGDGGPARLAKFRQPSGVATGPDGSIYIADSGNSRVRKISPDGIITTIAGNGMSESTAGDGGPATQAALTRPGSVALAADGTLYIATTEGSGISRVRRVTPDGIITTVAGGGSSLSENVPALQALIRHIRGVAVGIDGSVFVSEPQSGLHRVRRISPDGRITTVAGGGTSDADGIPATSARLLGPGSLAVTRDGSLYVATTSANSRVRRISPDGIITTVAGVLNGSPSQFYIHGVPATQVGFNTLASVALTPDGGFLIGHREESRVLHVSSVGMLTRFAGGGTKGAQATPVPPLQDVIVWPYGMAVMPNGDVIVSDVNSNRLVRITGRDGPLSAREFRIPSADGSEIYIFDNALRHVRTIDSMLGTVVFRFEYDAAGRLVRIIDRDGLTTMIDRRARGAASAIVAPAGERIELQIENGHLTRAATSGGEVRRFEYTADGLLTSYTDPKQQTHTFAYDGAGRLTADHDPAGGFSILSGAQSGFNNYTVAVTTAEGRSSTFDVVPVATGEVDYINTDPAGLRTRTRRGSEITTRFFADGMVTMTRVGSDPRFGMEAPIVVESFIRTPAFRQRSVSRTRTAVFTDASDPSTLTSLTDVFRVNGSVYRSVFDAASRTVTATTPANRISRTVFDQNGRATESSFGDLLPATVQYDARGRVSEMRQGDRRLLLSYDERDRLTRFADALGRMTELTYDDKDRPTVQALPGGRAIHFGYDANGNVTAVTPPGRPQHTFDYTAAGLPSRYTAPGGHVTEMFYNRDRQLIGVKPPSGRSVGFVYDPAGRIQTISSDDLTYTYSYHPATGVRTGATTSSGASLVYAFDGVLPTSVSWSGPVTGAVSFSWDSTFRLTQESVAGVPVSFGYDPDDLLTSAGTLALTREAQTGFLIGTTLGKTADAWTYNAVGDVMSYTAAHESVTLLSLTYERDAAGRLIAINSDDLIRGFEYDASGRLVRVTTDGTAIAEYDYDVNGNRTGHRYLGGSQTATYDQQDRLLTYGDTVYEYSADGDLRSKTIAGSTTAYDYDAFGNLRSVELPGGTRIEYIIDGQNRRVGKVVDGTRVKGWLYSTQLRIVAELDGENNVVSRFVYATRTNVPDYMIRDGVSYRIISDHLGSPRAVVNIATGEIAQAMTYDEFGRVLADSAPEFQPFGFAGGLWDADTRLVRFGARDYDPQTGRWTAKEPLGIAGGDSNFYAYAFNDPVNLIDPNGLYAFWDDLAFAAGGALFGAGAQALSDAISGEFSGWGAYGRAAAGGALGGITTLYFGPVAGGAVGTAATNALNQRANIVDGTQCGFNWASLGLDTTLGAVTGKVFGAANMGVGTPRGSAAHVFKTTRTALRNGTISSIRPATGVKMFVGAAEEYQIGLGTAVGVTAANAYGNLADGGCGCN